MKTIMITALLASCALLAKAQNTENVYNLANTAMTFLNIPSDARSAAMGEMGVATPASNYAHQNNAAKYLFMDARQKGGLNLFYAPWLRNLVKDMSIAGVSGFYRIDDLQSVSGSFRYFSMGEMKFVDSEQSLTGNHNPYELALDFAYARKLSETFSMSVALRYGMSNLADKSNSYYRYKTAHVFAFDVTGYYAKEISVLGMESTLGAGFALTNVGTRVKYGEDRKFFLPADLKVGVNLASRLNENNGLSLGVEVGKYLVSSAVSDLDKSVFGAIGASFSEASQFKSLVWKVGAEYDFNRMVFVRAGYFYENEERGDRQYLTTGVGLAYKIVRLDGSYLIPTSGRQNPLENTFRVSVSVDF